MAAAAAHCVALGNRRLAGAPGNPLDCWEPIGHPACGPGLSDFECAQRQGDFSSGSGLRLAISTSVFGDIQKKRQTRIAIPLVDVSTSKMEEEANETS
jgi:hypothetical protein